MSDMRETLAKLVKMNAAVNGYGQIINEPLIADAIIAALPDMVRPLQWESDEDLPALEDATGCGHLYRVIRRSTGKASLRIDNMNCEHSEHENDAAARAAAQSHFTAEAVSAFGVQGGEA